MLKKFIVCSLATGLLFSGGISVSASSEGINQNASLSNINLENKNLGGEAYLHIQNISGSLILTVNGLQSPFEPNYYQKIAFTDSPSYPNSYNTLKEVYASNTSYPQASLEVKNIRHRVSSGGTIYAYALTKSGQWYYCGSDQIYYD